MLNGTRSLIIGKGEVGNSLHSILAPVYETYIRDREETEKYPPIHVLHICYPYFEGFIETTNEYIDKYQPEITVIHSTVPVGTTEKFTKIVVHSPVRGRHPDLAQGIRTYAKYIGVTDESEFYALKDYFKKAGLKPVCVVGTKNTEAAKIWCTTRLGWDVLMEKEIHKYCVENDLDYSFIYHLWNEDYNRGIKKIGDTHLIRPILMHDDGEIGGHCVIPNAHLIQSYITDLILQKNEEYKNETH